MKYGKECDGRKLFTAIYAMAKNICTANTAHLHFSAMMGKKGKKIIFGDKGQLMSVLEHETLTIRNVLK